MPAFGTIARWASLVLEAAALIVYCGWPRVLGEPSWHKVKDETWVRVRLAPLKSVFLFECLGLVRLLLLVALWFSHCGPRTSKRWLRCWSLANALAVLGCLATLAFRFHADELGADQASCATAISCAQLMAIQ